MYTSIKNNSNVFLSSISSTIELWSVNHPLINEDSELNDFTNIKLLIEICDN